MKSSDIFGLLLILIPAGFSLAVGFISYYIIAPRMKWKYRRSASIAISYYIAMSTAVVMLMLWNIFVESPFDKRIIEGIVVLGIFILLGLMHYVWLRWQEKEWLKRRREKKREEKES